MRGAPGNREAGRACSPSSSSSRRPSCGTPLLEAARDALPLLARSASMMLYAAAAALPWVVMGALVWKLRRRARVRRLIRIAGAEG
jgi:hypothetical protein